MKIAQIAPLIESVPPRLYGGTERIASYVTEELVALGHAAIRGRGHRTLDRNEGAKLGPSPAFIAYLCRAFAPRCNIRGDERPLLARCGATP